MVCIFSLPLCSEVGLGPTNGSGRNRCLPTWTVGDDNSGVCTPYHLLHGQTPWPPFQSSLGTPPSMLGGGSAVFTPLLPWGALAGRAMLSTDTGLHLLSAAVQTGRPGADEWQRPQPMVAYVDCR